jgi:hypothetical protein
MENIHDVNADTSKGTGGSEEADELDLFIGQEDEGMQESVDSLKAELTKAKDANKRLYARLKKEEKVEIKTKQDTTNEYLTKDEAILIAKGMDLEDIEQAKLIQKGMGSSLKDALENPLFKSYMAQKEAEEVRRKAQLGASGGGSAKVDEGFNKPDLTPEQHRKLWEERQK